MRHSKRFIHFEWFRSDAIPLFSARIFYILFDHWKRMAFDCVGLFLCFVSTSIYFFFLVDKWWKKYCGGVDGNNDFFLFDIIFCCVYWFACCLWDTWEIWRTKKRFHNCIRTWIQILIFFFLILNNYNQY